MNAPRVETVIRDAAPWSEGRSLGVRSVAIGGGRVLATGPEADALAASAPEVLDAGGATLTPGLTDAHIHLLAWARSLDQLGLSGAASAEDVARRIAGEVAAAPGDGTLVGRGWDDHGWASAPHRAALDRVAPGRPVLLHSHDFHALWLNGEALRRAGITARTPDPEGGRIERDARGEPTGVLREHAVRLAAALHPVPDDASDARALARAAAALNALGITAVHVFEGARSRRLLRGLACGTAPPLRVLMNLPHESLEGAIAVRAKSGAGTSTFRIGAIKLFADGTLGSRTAALLDPFAGTDSTGMDLIPPDEMRRLVDRALRARLAVAVHAIGDRALRSTLDAFEATGGFVRTPALPSRIEHVQLAAAGDLPRFAAMGIVASLQPTHATSDIDAAERWWGDRLDRVYPWRTLLDHGARLAFGSDAPVEPPGGARTLHAAVTRARADGTPAGGWTPRERLTLDEALTASTEGPSRVAGTWPGVGRIAVGTMADLVLWDRDLHAAPAERLGDASPRRTWLAGRTVFDASAPRVAGAPLERGAIV